MRRARFALFIVRPPSTAYQTDQAEFSKSDSSTSDPPVASSNDPAAASSNDGPIASSNDDTALSSNEDDEDDDYLMLVSHGIGSFLRGYLKQLAAWPRALHILATEIKRYDRQKNCH